MLAPGGGWSAREELAFGLADWLGFCKPLLIVSPGAMAQPPSQTTTRAMTGQRACASRRVKFDFCDMVLKMKR